MLLRRSHVHIFSGRGYRSAVGSQLLSYAYASIRNTSDSSGEWAPGSYTSSASYHNPGPVLFCLEVESDVCLDDLQKLFCGHGRQKKIHAVGGK